MKDLDGSLSDAQVAFLSSVDSPTVANAFDLLHQRDRTEGYLSGTIACQFPEFPPVVGRAVTVAMASKPGSPPSMKGYWHMWETLEASPGPSVLVIQDLSPRPARCAFFGEIMAHLAVRLGAVGVITDGGVRDLAEVRALGFHYFAPYSVVSHGNFEILSVDKDVVVGDQRISSGDIIHGDVNGVVAFQPKFVDQLVPAVERIRTRERAYLELLTSSDFSLPAFRRLRDRA